MSIQKLLLIIFISCIGLSGCAALAELGEQPPETDVVGTIVSSTGTPVIGAHVSLVSKTGYKPLKRTQSDETGTYSFTGLSTGFYSLYAESSGEAGVLQNVYYNESKKGGYTLSRLKMTRKTGILGTVLFENEGISDISVYLNGTPLVTTSNSRGIYALSGIPDGKFDVTYSKLGYREVTVPLVVTSGNISTINLDDVELEIENRTGNLTGMVELQGKDDDSGALVEIPEMGVTTNTLEDGSFSITVPVGVYSSISFSKRDFISKSIEGDYRVKENESTFVGTVALTSIANTVKGNATVHGKSSHEGIDVKLLETEYETTTDVSGNYQLNSVPFGTYQLQFSFPNASTIKKIIVVKPANDIVVDDVVMLPAGNIGGQLVLDGLTDYSGVTVSVVQGRFNYMSTTPENGTFSFSNVPIGLYTLTGTRVGFDDAEVTVSVTEGVTANMGAITMIDTTAPETIDDVDSTWVNTDVEVALTATDAGVGVASTHYIQDGVTLNVSESGLPLFAEEGVYQLLYFSKDRVGNIEDTKTSNEIRIDKSIEIERVSENSQGVKKKLGDTVHFLVDTNEPGGTVTVSIQDLVVTLQDDGNHGDTTANDGIYELAFEIDNTIDAKATHITAVFVDKANNVTESVLETDISMDGIVPVAPKDMALVPTSHEIAVEWQANSESDIAGYNVWKSTTEHGTYSKINDALVTQNQYIDDGLDNVVTYYYYVTAVDENGNESSASNKAYTFAASFRYGTISQTEDWDAYDNPFIMMDDVKIPEGVIVNAGAGVQIWGFEGSSLTVQGRLLANGEEGNPIKVTSIFESGDSGFWGGIDIETDVSKAGGNLSNAGSSLLYCDVEHTDGITISNGGSAQIKNCNLTTNTYGIQLVDADVSFIQSNTIYENTYSGVLVAATGGGETQDVTIDSNTITAHPIYGIESAGNPEGTVSGLIISNNTFSDNVITAVKLGDSEKSTVRNSVVQGNTFEHSPSFTGDLTVGVYLSGTGNSVLRNSFIRHYYGVRMDDAEDATVQNNTFTGNTAWALTMAGDTIDGLVESNTFTDNTNAIRVGESRTLSTVINNYIRYNQVVDNVGLAFQINNVPQIEIELNNIFDNNGNGKNQVEITIDEPIEFDSNYWNTTNPNKIKTYVYDFYDNDDVGKIIWEPALEDIAPAGVEPES